MNRRVTSPTWGLPPPLVARKNADSKPAKVEFFEGYSLRIID